MKVWFPTVSSVAKPHLSVLIVGKQKLLTYFSEIFLRKIDFLRNNRKGGLHLYDMNHLSLRVNHTIWARASLKLIIWCAHRDKFQHFLAHHVVQTGCCLIFICREQHRLYATTPQSFSPCSPLVFTASCSVRLQSRCDIFGMWVSDKLHIITTAKMPCSFLLILAGMTNLSGLNHYSCHKPFTAVFCRLFSCIFVLLSRLQKHWCNRPGCVHAASTGSAMRKH